MGCETRRDAQGRMVAVVCSRGRKHNWCKACGGPYTKLCDWPTMKTRGGKPITCDAPLCDGHTFSPAPNIDYCQEHAERYRQAAAQETEGR